MGSPAKNIIPAKVGVIDSLLLSIAPKMAMDRIQAKVAFNHLSQAGYITPRKNKRSMRGWFTRNGSADVDTLPDLNASRSASRDLYMNTPIATGAVRRMKTNTIGAGLRLQSRIDRDFLGLTEEEADAWERNTEREFFLWANSKNCDAARTSNFSQLQQLAFLSMLMSGDVFALLPFRRLSNFPYQLAIQLLESDQCENPDSIDDFVNDRTRGGIEVDNFGAPISYWFRSKHPGDTVLERKWTKIPAFGSRSGRRQVIHVFDKERPGQRRGMPMLAPVIEILKQLTRLSESELMAAVVASYYTVFITKKDNVTQPMQNAFAPGTSVLNEAEIPQDANNQELAPGMIMGLEEGEGVEVADPSRPNDSFEPFFQAIVKQIGSSLGIPFELLMLHFTASYSASRGAILEGWKTFREKRENFETQFCQPIYEEWLNEAVFRGRINAPGFFSDPITKSAWTKSKWGGPGMGQIDPKKETEASLLLIDGNLSTHEDEAQKITGGDWDGTINRKAREVSKINNLNINQTNTITAEEDVEDE